MSIKDKEVDAAARTRAHKSGESLTAAVKLSILERLERIEAQEARRAASPHLKRFIERGRARATLDSHTTHLAR